MPPQRSCQPEVEGYEREVADAAFSVPGGGPEWGYCVVGPVRGMRWGLLSGEA